MWCINPPRAQLQIAPGAKCCPLIIFNCPEVVRRFLQPRFLTALQPLGCGTCPALQPRHRLLPHSSASLFRHRTARDPAPRTTSSRLHHPGHRPSSRHHHRRQQCSRPAAALAGRRAPLPAPPSTLAHRRWHRRTICSPRGGSTRARASSSRLKRERSPLVSASCFCYARS